MTTERASSIQGVIARDSIVARRRPIADFFNSIDAQRTEEPVRPSHPDQCQKGAALKGLACLIAAKTPRRSSYGQGGLLSASALSERGPSQPRASFQSSAGQVFSMMRAPLRRVDDLGH
jgi:hypothetical protein